MSCLLMLVIDCDIDVASEARRQLLFRILKAGIERNIMLQMDYENRSRKFIEAALASGGLPSERLARDPIIAIMSWSPEYSVSDEAIFYYEETDHSPVVDGAYRQRAMLVVAENLKCVADVVRCIARFPEVRGLSIIFDNHSDPPTRSSDATPSDLDQALISAFEGEPLDFPNACIDVQLD